MKRPKGYLGLWDYRGKNWDYGIPPCLKLGLQKSANQTKGIFHPCKIGITGLHPFRNWDYGITLFLKSGLLDYRTPPAMGALL